MVNSAAICMYMHRVNTAVTGMVHIQDYRAGNVPHIPYSLHMLTTLGRGLLGQDKGILGQLGTLLSCTTLCSLS